MRTMTFNFAGILVGILSVISIATSTVRAEDTSTPATPRPVILLYNAGLPSTIDDQSTSWYLFELTRYLNLQQVFDVRNGGGSAGTSIANGESAATSLCQTKGLNPIGVIMWQLYGQRSTSNFVVFKHYATDAHLGLSLFRCTGSADTAFAVSGPTTRDVNNDGLSKNIKSFSLPLLGILGSVAVADSRINMSGASKTATVGAVLAGGIPSIQGFPSVTLPELFVNEPRDRNDVIESVLTQGAIWFSSQHCGYRTHVVAPTPDPAAIAAIDQAELAARAAGEKTRDREQRKLAKDIVAQEEILKSKALKPSKTTSNVLYCDNFPAPAQ